MQALDSPPGANQVRPSPPSPFKVQHSVMTQPSSPHPLAVASVLAALSAVPVAGAIFLSGPLQLICIAVGVALWIWALVITFPLLLPLWVKEPLRWRPIAWFLTRLYGKHVILIKQGSDWQWRCPYSDHWNYNLHECPCGAVLDMKRGRAKTP